MKAMKYLLAFLSSPEVKTKTIPTAEKINATTSNESSQISKQVLITKRGPVLNRTARGDATRAFQASSVSSAVNLAIVPVTAQLQAKRPREEGTTMQGQVEAAMKEEGTKIQGQAEVDMTEEGLIIKGQAEVATKEVG